jgi:ubiquinone/menaquinone biosynthesis C-methylase UbiE
MATDIDPEGRETQALYTAADFRGKRVLEIGCGAGRLMRRYADAASFAGGVDSSFESLWAARHDRPRELARRLAHIQAAAFALPFAAGVFDIVLFGWSL